MEEEGDLEELIRESDSKIKEYEHLVVKFAEEAEEAKTTLNNVAFQRDALHNELYQLHEKFSWREGGFTSQLMIAQNEFTSLNKRFIDANEATKKLAYLKDNEINKLNDDVSQKQELFDNAVNALQKEVERLIQLNQDEAAQCISVTNKLQTTSTELHCVKEELAQHRQMYNENIDALQQCFQDVAKNNGLLEEQLTELQQKYQGKCVVLFISSFSD